MNWRLNARMRASVVLTLSILGTSACSDFLTVQDPGRFTDESLNTPLALVAVANGVQADLVQQADNFGSTFGLISDEFMHTGTWQGDFDLDAGRTPSTLGGTGGFQGNLLAVRTASQNAQERLIKVMGDTANRSVLMARVVAVEAWANLYMGMYNCESPKGPNGDIVSDIETLKLSIPLFTKAADIARSANNQDFQRWATAGRARAKLFSGDFDGALADAALVPDNFVFTAKFDATNSSHTIASLAYRTRLKAAGLDRRHWAKVDTVAGFIRDPYTNQHDRRLVITHLPQERGADGVTQYYNQEKFDAVDDDAVLTSGWEMRLIEAEANMKKGNLGPAMTLINRVRANAQLNAVTATDPAKVQEHLLWERFSQMYLEGHRLYDIHRYNLARTVLGTSQATDGLWPTQYPLDGGEINLNPNTKGSLTGRCFPRK